MAGGCARDDALFGDRQADPEVFEAITRPVADGSVHIVRLLQRGDQYAFDPDVVTVSSGDVLRFVMVGSQPESIVFDPNEATAEAGEFIRSNQLHLGVLLTDAGQVYEVSFLDAPVGRYPFVSLPHAVHGMRGVVDVID